MIRKRRIPSGKMPRDMAASTRSLENEIVSLGLDSTPPTQSRLRRRHPELSATRVDELDRLCREVLETCFDIAASLLSSGGDSLQVRAQILNAYPWIDVDNLDRLYQRSCYLAK